MTPDIILELYTERLDLLKELLPKADPELHEKMRQEMEECEKQIEWFKGLQGPLVAS